MKNYAIGLSSVFVCVLASFVALYFGVLVAAVAFLLLAVTPIPAAVAYAIHDRIAPLRER